MDSVPSYLRLFLAADILYFSYDNKTKYVFQFKSLIYINSVPQSSTVGPKTVKNEQRAPNPRLKIDENKQSTGLVSE